MRIPVFFLVAMSMVGLMVGCGSDSDSVTGGQNTSLVTVLWVYYNNDTSVSAEGFITANPMPGFNYIKLGDSTFTGKDYYYIDFGYLYFGTANAYGATDPVTAEISSTAGKTSGTLPFPGYINNVTVSADTIATGGSVTVSWTSNADNVYIDTYCQYYDLQNNYHYVSMDTIVSGQSCTFDLSFVTQNGRFKVASVSSFNGPKPEAGAAANMSGSGAGFMVYMGPNNYVNKSVIIGSGYPISEWHDPAPPTRDEMIQRAKKTLLGIWGLE